LELALPAEKISARRGAQGFQDRIRADIHSLETHSQAIGASGATRLYLVFASGLLLFSLRPRAFAIAWLGCGMIAETQWHRGKSTDYFRAVAADPKTSFSVFPEFVQFASSGPLPEKTSFKSLHMRSQLRIPPCRAVAQRAKAGVWRRVFGVFAQRYIGALRRARLSLVFSRSDTRGKKYRLRGLKNGPKAAFRTGTGAAAHGKYQRERRVLGTGTPGGPNGR
jgi:hypothetical protein